MQKRAFVQFGDGKRPTVLVIYLLTFTFSALKAYIYTCGVDALKTMGIECFPEQIRDAFLATQLLKERYSVDLKAEISGSCKGIS